MLSGTSTPSVPPLVVLDTNVFLVSISSRSPFHWIYKELVEERYSLAISTDIALEYEEVSQRKMGYDATINTMSFLDVAPNVVWTERHYRWHLITADPDDNKFVDCAVASGAERIVTEDRHFNVLKEINFPRIRVTNIYSFSMFLTRLG